MSAYCTSKRSHVYCSKESLEFQSRPEEQLRKIYSTSHSQEEDHPSALRDSIRKEVRLRQPKACVVQHGRIGRFWQPQARHFLAQQSSCKAPSCIAQLYVPIVPVEQKLFFHKSFPRPLSTRCPVLRTPPNHLPPGAVYEAEPAPSL